MGVGGEGRLGGGCSGAGGGIWRERRDHGDGYGKPRVMIKQIVGDVWGVSHRQTCDFNRVGISPDCQIGGMHTGACHQLAHHTTMQQGSISPVLLICVCGFACLVFLSVLATGVPRPGGRRRERVRLQVVLAGHAISITARCSMVGFPKFGCILFCGICDVGFRMCVAIL